MSTTAVKILLIDRKNGLLLHYLANGDVKSHPLASGLAGMIAKTGKHECVPNAYSHECFNGQVDLDTTMPLIIWPVKDACEETEVIGIIEIVHVKGIEGLSTTNKAKLTTHDIETVEFFSKQFSRMVMNKLSNSKSNNEGGTIESSIHEEYHPITLKH